VPATQEPPIPAPATDPTGAFVHYLEWHHESWCSQSFAHVEIKALFQLTIPGDGTAALVLGHEHHDTSGPNPLSTPRDPTDRPQHHSAAKQFRWDGTALVQGDRLLVTLGPGECAWTHDGPPWILFECPDEVPPLTYTCSWGEPASVALPFEAREPLPPGDPVLQCETPTPEELAFGLWVLREPLVLAHGAGVQRRVFLGDNLIEGELIRPEGPIGP